MWQNVRQLILWLIVGSLVFSLVLIGVETLSIEPANAAIRQIEEAPGQFLYQSRQTIKDQHENSWQAIAFKRILPDNTTILALRLVGFPGTVEINRSQDLMVTDSLGKTLSAPDVSDRIFAEDATPEPSVGQYDIAPIISELVPIMPLKLSLSTTQGEPVELWVSPTTIKEWQTLLQKSSR